MISAMAASNPLSPNLATPEAWAASLRRPPVISSDPTRWRSGLVRRWTGLPAHMVQPPIDHHYIVIHLGGRKQVTRAGGGRTLRAEVPDGALTLVPAGTRYDWLTRGPIDFAHLYVPPARLNRVIASRFDRDPGAVTLDEQVGFEDPLLAQAMRAMLAGADDARPGAVEYLESLFEFTLAHLAHHHSTMASTCRPAHHALAPARLRRVIDLAEARMSQRLCLADLAAEAGLSRFHFSRAFKDATGEPPAAWLAQRRLDAAKRLLRNSELSLAEIARQTGHGSPSQFAAAFRRRTGRTASDYRHRL